MTTMNADRPCRLLDLARRLVSSTPDFQVVRGPGAGDHATRLFMRKLQEAARARFGEDLCERQICGDNEFAVDFYFREEATIVEVALGLPNPTCEFEKDILKAIMAQDLGHEVRRLF